MKILTILLISTILTSCIIREPSETAIRFAFRKGECVRIPENYRNNRLNFMGCPSYGTIDSYYASGGSVVEYCIYFVCPGGETFRCAEPQVLVADKGCTSGGAK